LLKKEKKWGSYKKSKKIYYKNMNDKKSGKKKRKYKK